MTGGPLDTRLLLAVGVGIAALIALALVAVGGPGTARSERLDEERRDDLRRIQRAIQRAESLPASLDAADLRLSEADRTDPLTGEPYGYRVLADSTYELCATFALSSEDLGRPEQTVLPRVQAIGPYEAGRHCVTVTPEASP